MKKVDLLKMLDALLPSDVTVRASAADNGWSVSLVITDHYPELPPEESDGTAPAPEVAV